eukprot:UN03733
MNGWMTEFGCRKRKLGRKRDEHDIDTNLILKIHLNILHFKSCYILENLILSEETIETIQGFVKHRCSC